MWSGAEAVGCCGLNQEHRLVGGLSASVHAPNQVVTEQIVFC